MRKTHSLNDAAQYFCSFKSRKRFRCLGILPPMHGCHFVDSQPLASFKGYLTVLMAGWRKHADRGALLRSNFGCVRVLHTSHQPPAPVS
jgi:hypothetical protein